MIRQKSTCGDSDSPANVLHGLLLSVIEVQSGEELRLFSGKLEFDLPKIRRSDLWVPPHAGSQCVHETLRNPG